MREMKAESNQFSATIQYKQKYTRDTRDVYFCTKLSNAKVLNVKLNFLNKATWPILSHITSAYDINKLINQDTVHVADRNKQ